MLRGSRPGERRGGRKRDTPNRRTILRDRILSLGVDHPAASQRAFLLKLVKDRKLPADTRMAVAPKCFPPKPTRSFRTGRPRALAGSWTTIAPKALATESAAGASTGSQTPAVVPAIRDWNPRALEALFGVVQDATANPKARRKAALKIAEFLLPKVGKKAKVIPDEYGFSINPNLASAYRDIQLELRALGPKARIYELEKRRVAEHLTPTEEEELQDLRRRHPRIAEVISNMNLVYDCWFDPIRQAEDICLRFANPPGRFSYYDLYQLRDDGTLPWDTPESPPVDTLTSSGNAPEPTK
jgi:hypothetical protein